MGRARHGIIGIATAGRALRPATVLLRATLLLRAMSGRALVLALAAALLATPPAAACTRALYVGADQVVITGRTMDWKEDMRSNLWVFPAGMARDGAAGPTSIRWTSRYGSLTTAGYDLGTTDGMNEAGLVTNLLYLVESDYGTLEGRPALSISLWAQYVLDNFASVAEAVTALAAEPFRLVAPVLPNGIPAQLHLAISDAQGDSAILQYIGGVLKIYHGRDYVVMTNSPPFDQQLALDGYWKSIGGLTFLPGTNRASDRFVRASFLIAAIPRQSDAAIISAVPGQSFSNQAVASVMSVMRAVSVPLGITTPEEPNISSTIWRTAADQKNKVYFFDSATSPNTFWVPLADLDLKPGAPVRTLTLEGGRVYAGNAADRFRDAPAYAPLPATP